MYELTTLDCQAVGGAFAPMAGVSFAIGLISSSGAIYSFFSGFLDGFNQLS